MKIQANIKQRLKYKLNKSKALLRKRLPDCFNKTPNFQVQDLDTKVTELVWGGSLLYAGPLCRKLVEAPSNFIAGCPKAALLFWFLGDFRRGVPLVIVILVFFVLSFFQRDVLCEIWDLIESVSEGFLTYSYNNAYIKNPLINKGSILN